MYQNGKEHFVKAREAASAVINKPKTTFNKQQQMFNF